MNRPLAYIYDRVATTNRIVLQMRLEACAHYAETRGWEIGGWFADEGDDALTTDTRPAFDAMCNTIRSTDVTTRRVCLVHDWDRLSHDQEACDLLTRRVLRLGV